MMESAAGVMKMFTAVPVSARWDHAGACTAPTSEKCARGESNPSLCSMGASREDLPCNHRVSGACTTRRAQQRGTHKHHLGENVHRVILERVNQEAHPGKYDAPLHRGSHGNLETRSDSIAPLRVRIVATSRGTGPPGSPMPEEGEAPSSGTSILRKTDATEVAIAGPSTGGAGEPPPPARTQILPRYSETPRVPAVV